ncbi:MAG: molybdenum cofactor guanylyltransferase [Desulfobacterales bacterium]|jgi:molybdopterin-guanine dinucleotide biosynthesis protein A
MTLPCSGIILSGGLNTRFNGQNKAFIQVGQKRILDRLYGVFSDLFDDIILVTNHPLEFLDWDLTIVTDIFSTRSSLTGIHAGLFFANNPYAFFSACDTPFLSKELVIFLIEQIESNTDIIMPQTAAGFEPLCSIYSKRCLKQAERHLKENKFKIQWAFQDHRIKFIPEKMLLKIDPDLISFFNINTPEDLIQAEEILAKSKAHGA